MRKKVVTILVAAITSVGMLNGCSGTGTAAEDEKTAESIQEEAESTSENTDRDDTSSSPTVYMTTDISSEGMIAVYQALQASPEGNIAVKLSTGEPGSNYLRIDLIGDLVRSFDAPTIVECNTAYGGSRANTAMHYQVAEDHIVSFHTTVFLNFFLTYYPMIFVFCLIPVCYRESFFLRILKLLDIPGLSARIGTPPAAS